MSTVDAVVIKQPSPFLRWCGGKRNLAPLLAKEIKSIGPKLYCEPFLGGGAVALALPTQMPKILADVNHHLIDCWLCIQKISGSLFVELKDVESRYGDHFDGYLAARDEFNAMINHPRRMWARRSALFLYLNSHGFNGIWRVNSHGCFNVPWGKLTRPRKLEAGELSSLADTLRQCDFYAADFSTVLDGVLLKRSRIEGRFLKPNKVLSGIAVYADCPYDGTFNGYAKGGFTLEDQQRLAIKLAQWANDGAAVWATNADTPLVREIYSWAAIEEIDEQHNVGSKAERRGKRSCVLIRGGATR